MVDSKQEADAAFTKTIERLYPSLVDSKHIVEFFEGIPPVGLYPSLVDSKLKSLRKKFIEGRGLYPSLVDSKRKSECGRAHVRALFISLFG
ncbi:protein of unknown function [Mesotoga infera]|uniref:Uncharacterized protein n=1 Tax=Mesotoga infera TaxID=1236046 RepID=A0A7Z7LFE9_9BACT|nr:protein of unknown function [Mesotoga infera]